MGGFFFPSYCLAFWLGMFRFFFLLGWWVFFFVSFFGLLLGLICVLHVYFFVPFCKLLNISFFLPIKKEKKTMQYDT